MVDHRPGPNSGGTVRALVSSEARRGGKGKRCLRTLVVLHTR